ncbi:MAG: hypothetical protein RR446_07385 [Lachnospiraceae bacterium]
MTCAVTVTMNTTANATAVEKLLGIMMTWKADIQWSVYGAGGAKIKLTDGGIMDKKEYELIESTANHLQRNEDERMNLEIKKVQEYVNGYKQGVEDLLKSIRSTKQNYADNNTTQYGLKSAT